MVYQMTSLWYDIHLFEFNTLVAFIFPFIFYYVPCLLFFEQLTILLPYIFPFLPFYLHFFITPYFSFVIAQGVSLIDKYAVYYRNIAFYVVWALAISSVVFLVSIYIFLSSLFLPFFLSFFFSSFLFYCLKLDSRQDTEPHQT